MNLSRYRHISHLFLCFLFCFICFNASAFDITTKPVGFYYGANYYFEDVNEAIKFINQRNKESYDNCVAGIGPYSGGFCSYNVARLPALKMSYPPQGPLMDGIYQVNYFRADRIYSGPTYRDNPGKDIDWSFASVLFAWFCPNGFNLRYQYESPDHSIKNGAYCIKEIVDLRSPPESCPVELGNPVDVLTRQKREHEIDYATADGILKLERFYVNQFVGWQYAAPSKLVDSTFDDVSGPGSCYAGSLIVNGTTRKSHCFQYIQNPESTDKLVTIKTGKNNQYIFKKDSSNNFTGTNSYTGQLTKLTSSEYAWLHKQRDNTFDYYSSAGLLMLRKLPNGRQLFYGYNDSTLTSISDDANRKIILNYDGAGRISYAVLPDGNQISYEYDSYNNVTRVTWPDGTSKQYLYNEDDLVTGESSPFYLTGKIDERGIRNGTYKYVYSTYPNMYVSTSQAGGVNKYIVSVTGVTNPMGIKSEYTHISHVLSDGTRLPKSQPQVAGSGCAASTRNFAYNSSGLLTQKTEFNDNITQYAYNTAKHENVRVEGLKTASSSYLNPNATLPAGARKISTEWHPDWRVKTRIAEAKKITTNIYNGQPDPFNSNQILNCAPASVTAPMLCKKVVQATTDVNGAAGFAAVLDASLAARVWQYTYNELGKTLTVSTPQSVLNNTVEIAYEYYSYDSTFWRKGDLKQISNALGHTTQYTRYDANGRLLELVDANGVVSQFTYDLRGRLLTATQAGATTNYTYDPVGNLIRVVSADGVTLEYDYDNASRLFRIRDLNGNKIEYTLDKASNITAINYSDNAGNLRYQQTRVYDALSRVQNIIDASNNSTTLKYDASGNLTSEVDANNKTTSQSYDALDQFKQRTDALSGKINYTFDAQGNLTNVKDPRNNSTGYIYNAFGELIEQNSPDTGKTTFNYNAAGNRISSTDARGIIVNYSYDALNRLTHITYPSASENVQFVYDNTQGGNKGIGRLTAITKNGETTSYVYNDAGFIKNKTVTVNGITSVTQYEYDLAGKPTRTIYPSGRVVNYLYNSLGLPDAITTQSSGNLQTVLSNIQYLPFGPAQSYVYGNGLTHSQTYDLNYRLTAIQVGSILDRNYTYDAVNNINGITNNIDLAQSQTFTYDALNRLTSALGGYGNLGYTYDAVGNRLTEVRNSTTDTYSYATTSNRLNSITRSAGNRNFTYDNAGNPTQRTSDDNKTHNNTFNNANRLSSVNVNGTLAANYTYNPLGQRVIKTLANGTKEIYHYDESGQLLSVTDQNNNTQREYIYWGNQQVALINNNTIYYIHNDHLNTPQVVTNQSQQVVWMGNYEPFGKLAQNQSNNIEIFSRFPGQYFDAETNLYYNYFRDYDPSIGRYIESDPIGLGGGINTYGYASQNPLSFYDQYGLFVDQAAFETLLAEAASTTKTAAKVGSRLNPWTAAASAFLPTTMGDGTLTPENCNNNDKCRELIAIVKAKADEVRRQWFRGLSDPNNLFENAFSTANLGKRKGTWVGHIEKFNNAKRGLRNSILEAFANKCAVDPMDVRLIDLEYPNAPAAR
jgi:RHS repeat-associated protein